ncbi:competence type IV pilus minor pilin ComGF [Mesobacillus zeae]|uniref:Prepilin-type N-terminal cleavage/methylation domain-containing protein n=1 Tax=Mesobacillus zeae TaxID=1917180 RepID=A0A398B1Z6_9BACI|nr:competence type IV pilus minor pilin ComGF [Mesobacillus zeae]RID83979.1 prepilin-type N-terminal cleavage/methylation domain-containing protein [Mesobacillus zeae]
MAIEKKSVQYAGLLNERGFTLAEMLLALTVFFVIMSMLPAGLNTVLKDGFSARRIQGFEWKVFNSQMKRELREAELVTVKKEKLIVQKGSNIILYEKYGNSIRRRVNYAGHEVMLQNVSQMKFSAAENGVGIYVKDGWDKEYSSNVRSFITLEVRE